MANLLEQEISRYNTWKEELIAAVEEYRQWLESTGQLDMQQSIRFYDLTEDLKRGRLMLAFIAEFSRGKTELINALFFAHLKQRLLPSDVGRTTMCPTEIYHDADEAPYLRLLPIETRFRDESIAKLKTTPVEWSTIRLNVESATDMTNAMKALADIKQVYVMEARVMGLLDEEAATLQGLGDHDKVEVPAWRYALINYPHPLLTRGLSILDMPGLNALGMEPELTLATLPAAHAALFLLGLDTGVTRSDMEVWRRYVRENVALRIAILNKIDLAWDELKPWDEIHRSLERQREATARLLSLPIERVLGLSAQKALLGKIRNDAELVEKSGILRLEAILAQEVIPAKQEIMSRAVMNEIGSMMLATGASVESRIKTNQTAVLELAEISGKSKEMVGRLWRKINQDKEQYNAALGGYKTIRASFNLKRNVLLDRLNQARVDEMLARSRAGLTGSWTTVGLHQAMNKLFHSINEEFDQIQRMATDMHALMYRSYTSFQTTFDFAAIALPPLDLENHRLNLRLLARETESFCKDPINLMTEKHFLIRKFYNSLVLEARKAFAAAGSECERWMRTVAMPLENQLRDHKALLQQRLDSLTKINQNSGSIQERLANLHSEQNQLIQQREMISRLISRVKYAEPQAKAA